MSRASLLRGLQGMSGNQAVMRMAAASAGPACESAGHDSASPVRTGVLMGRPGDPYEQEADRVAERVMRMPAPSLQRSCGPCAAGGPPCAKCSEESEKSKGPVQRARDASAGGSDSHAASVGSGPGSGAGQPLSRSLRDFFEPRNGYDFGHVRIHTDGAAAESAASVGSLAYTLGRDIVFGAGQYEPGTSRGRGLLAHELTHVVQQGSPHFESESRQAGRRHIGLESPLPRSAPYLARKDCPSSYSNCLKRASCGLPGKLPTGKCTWNHGTKNCDCQMPKSEAAQRAAEGAIIGTLLGTIVGAIGGGLFGLRAGAVAGTAVAPGPGTVVGGVGGGAAGVVGGMEVGALVGAAAGGAIGGLIGWLTSD